ncbi:THAP domain-containing protein 11-like [Thalassophryne amazonica]|uniref:THAP domain-containing protein 11-like n=1 Tax=Thalassophryne amazonica TaxID=390379 RepID=UPI0014725961|nr:THAP domain-containing protein 11-like [Thalassophryne amazonica]
MEAESVWTTQLQVCIRDCDCPRPFQLFPFPTEPARRAEWTKIVNRKQLGSGYVKNWTPNKNSRVCSVHFTDGKPTELHPNPTLQLGYELKQVGNCGTGGTMFPELGEACPSSLLLSSLAEPALSHKVKMKRIQQKDL